MVAVPHVYILTWCRDPAALYGSLLTFSTLRRGFPTAAITVVDNVSLVEVRPSIRAAVEACGATYRQLDAEIAHHEFIRIVVERQEGPAVFTDPDLCFWDAVEHWDFSGALAAGRLIPPFHDEYTGCLTHARLHTSLLFVPDVQKLREEIQQIRRKHFEWHPLQPATWVQDGQWHRLDTGANLYSVLSDRMHAFTEKQLGAYDHLFVGSHLSAVAPTLAKDGERFVELHRRVREGDMEALRGAWKRQEEFFRKRRRGPGKALAT